MMASGGNALARMLGPVLLLVAALVPVNITAELNIAVAQAVQNVPDDDPGMRAAYAKARKTLPDFWARVARPAAGELFSVKLRYVARSGGDELIWANHPVLLGRQVTAVIDNEPVDIQGLKIGDRVTVSVDRVVDWIINRGGKIHGGYTIRALLPHVSPQEAAELRAMLAPE